MRRMLVPAVIIGFALFFVIGLHEQIVAAARSCAEVGGNWVAVDTVDWMSDPKEACEL